MQQEEWPFSKFVPLKLKMKTSMEDVKIREPEMCSCFTLLSLGYFHCEEHGFIETSSIQYSNVF